MLAFLENRELSGTQTQGTGKIRVDNFPKGIMPVTLSNQFHVVMYLLSLCISRIYLNLSIIIFQSIFIFKVKSFLDFDLLYIKFTIGIITLDEIFNIIIISHNNRSTIIKVL